MKYYFLMVLFVSALGFSQDQSGYYITEDNQRVDGYFKTTDFNDSGSLKFKKSAEGDYAPLEINNIKEYGIGSAYKFIKRTIKADIADNNSDRNLTHEKDPQYQTMQVFLNVIIEGKASLYSVQLNKSSRFFYSLDGNPELIQLVYKRFYTSQDKIAENALYKQQIYRTINCNNDPIENFKYLKYNREDLIEVIQRFNKCVGGGGVEYSNKGGKQVKVLYSVFGGVYGATFNISGNRFVPEKGDGTSYGFGGEIALALPSETWEFFVRAEYEILNAETSTTFDQGYNHLTNTFKLSANVINVYVGPRFNFVLNDKNKIYLDGAMGLSLPSGDITLSSVITPPTGEAYEGVHQVFDLSTTACFNFGVGYTFNNKIGASIRYETAKNLFDNTFTEYGADVSRIGVNLKYTLN